ncbi:InlB B-repeat-containing protein [Anaerococcus sp. ENR0831]|uniref:InlB B-repeat-containing protein n=1 Tax=Anaerococcus martiniensis TaxID=3115615 RepID=A0ABW9MAA7_9FIRM
MKYKLMSAIMAFSMLVSSTIAPLAASKSYASAEIEENPTIMNKKIDEVGNDEKPNEISDTKLDIPESTEENNEKSTVETKTEEEKSEIQAEEETKKGTTTEENLEEEIKDKVKIVKKSVDVDLYEDSSYYTISNEDIDIQITGQMPENGTIKAYEIQNPIIDMEKVNVLGFGFGIFDKDGNLYDKNLADEYEIEIRSEKISDLDKIYIYEKNKNNVRFTETRDFSKLSDKVKVVSKADEFAIAKDIEKEEKQTQIEKTSEEEKSPFLSIEDKKVVNEKNSAEKEIEQPKDILDSLTNSAIEKQDTEAINEKADEKTSSDLELVDWKKDLLDTFAGTLENEKPVDEENSEETSNNEETVREDHQSENLTPDSQITDEEENSDAKTDASEESDQNEDLDEETSEENIEKPEAEVEIEDSKETEEKLTYQQVLAEIYTDSSYGQKADDQTRIKLSGKLPGYTKVKAYPVEITIEGKEVLAAYDITIFDENDDEYKVTEKNDIQVQITNQKIKEADEVDVYHKENKFAPEEKISVENKSKDTVTFKAESFSIYAITSPEAQATRTYEFYVRNADGSLKLINTQTIRNGQSLQKPVIPIIENNGRYAGWFPIGSEMKENGPNEIHFFTPINFTTTTPVTIKAEPLFLNNAYIDFKERVYITEKNKKDFPIPAGYTLDSDGFYKNAKGDKLYRDEVFKTRVQNFGEAIGTAHVPVVKDEAPTDPDEPAPVLSYWSIDPDGGEIFDFSQPITRQLIRDQEAISGEEQQFRLDLFAIYESGYTVSFDSQGGSHVTRQIVKKGDTLDMNKLIDPIKPGYVFKGWSLTPGGEIINLENRIITQSKTLYAIYDKLPGTYTVSHYTENINDTGYTFYNSETKVEQVGNYTKDGEYFRNPANSEIAKDLVEKGYTVPKSVTPSDKPALVKADGSTNIKVYYRRPRYNLTVYSTGVFQGVPTRQFIVQYKEGEDTKDTWDRMGQILGRYVVREGSLDGPIMKVPPKMPAHDLSLYFLPTRGNEDWYTNYIEVDENDVPIRDENGNLKVIRKTTHNAVIAGWENYVGGDTLEGFEYRYVTKPGQNEDSPKVYTRGQPKEVRTFYKRLSYQLVFKTNNINYDDRIKTVPYETQIAPLVPTDIKIGGTDKNGATFKGWYDNPQLTGLPVDFTNLTMPAKDTTYFGKWEQEKYAVRIYREMTTPGQSVGPGKMEEIQVGRNTKLSQSDSRLWANKPEKIKDETNVKLTWYRFSGSQFEPYDFNEPITESIFLYPVWSYFDPVSNSYRPIEDIHRITYTDGKNSFVDKNLYLNNAAAILQPPYLLDNVSQLDDPKNLNDKYFGDFVAPDGKHFQGWLLNNNPSRIYRPGEVVNVTGDMTFYAKWGEMDKTKITLYEQKPGTDKKLSKTETIRENGTVSLPAPTVENYVFQGWSKKPDGPVAFEAGQEVMVTSENMPNELYGIWKANRSITIHENQPSGTQNTYTERDVPDSTIKLSKPNAINGYRFLGWSTEEGDTIPEYEPEVQLVVSGDNPLPENLYGVWQKVNQVTFHNINKSYSSSYKQQDEVNIKVSYELYGKTETYGEKELKIGHNQSVSIELPSDARNVKYEITPVGSFKVVSVKPPQIDGRLGDYYNNGSDNLQVEIVVDLDTITYHSNISSINFKGMQKSGGGTYFENDNAVKVKKDIYNTVYQKPEIFGKFMPKGFELIGWSTTPDGKNLISYPSDTKLKDIDENDLYAVWSKPKKFNFVVERQDESDNRPINVKVQFDNYYKDEVEIGISDKAYIDTPTKSEVKNIIVDYEDYPYEIVGPEGPNSDGKFNTYTYKIIIKNNPPVPTGLIDNLAPMVMMLVLASLAFAYRLYKRNKLVGGIDE